jgi:hypothetical protein
MRHGRIAIATIVIGVGAAISASAAPAASGMSPKGETQKGETQKPAAANAVAAPSIGLSLGPPRRLLQPGQLDMTFMPDMHMAVLQRPDQSYRVFITARLGGSHYESTAVLATKDFLTYSPDIGSPTHPRPVLDPSCDGVTKSCLHNFDADYAGANAVFTAANSRDLLSRRNGKLGGRPRKLARA